MLSIYALRDRLVQRALLDIVQPLSEPRFCDASFGFRPGRSVALAVSRAQALVDIGYHWLVDADIQQCFDRVPRRALLDAVGLWLDDDVAPALIARCLGWQWADLTPDARGIPQGSCLSPWLCNVYLNAFDECSEHARVPLVRYADDFILFAVAREDAQEVLQWCSEWLAALGLALHPLKTRLANACDCVRFLGRTLKAPLVHGAEDTACC